MGEVVDSIGQPQFAAGSSGVFENIDNFGGEDKPAKDAKIRGSVPRLRFFNDGFKLIWDRGVSFEFDTAKGTDLLGRNLFGGTNGAGLGLVKGVNQGGKVGTKVVFDDQIVGVKIDKGIGTDERLGN